jgi:hypothetical protein
MNKRVVDAVEIVVGELQMTINRLITENVMKECLK